MPEYKCECCNYITKIRSQFERHKLTKKHAKNMELAQKKYKQQKDLETKNKRTCLHCNKVFSSISSVKRHIENSCRKNKQSEFSKKYRRQKYRKKQEYLNSITNKMNMDNIILDYSSSENDSDNEDSYKLNINKVAQHILENENLSNKLSIINKLNYINTDLSLENETNIVNTVVNTNISINGQLIEGDPMKKPEIKNILISSFSHPYFKNNINFVPLTFFNDDEFLFWFNHNHNLNIQKPGIE